MVLLRLKLLLTHILLFVNRIQLKIGQWIRKEKPLTTADIELISWLLNHSCFDDYLCSMLNKIDAGELTRNDAINELHSLKNDFKGGN